MIIKEGDIVLFYYKDAEKKKYSINIEIIKIKKDNFTGVILTSKKINKIYPGDYILPKGIMPKPTKAICDQLIKINKEDIVEKIGKVDKKTLFEIRNKVIKSIFGEDFKI